MTDLQLYLAIGVPSVLVLIGMFVNIGYFVTVNARITSLESRLDTRIYSLENRLDGRITSIEAKFDLLTGKVIEVDNRLTRIEEQLKH
ncbi:MAG: hypothetical protein ABSH09_25500 [Bryobacteraceae bacterium]|jgi:flagellar capping protein FliD